MGYVAYFQLNIDYIINTYCVNKEKPELKCNGNCHLTKQLSSASYGLDNEAPDFSLLADAFYPLYFHNLDYRTSEVFLFFNLKKHWNYYLNDINFYVSECFHPPDLLV
ncbi:hypothetical protein [Lacinutrix mariniflava]|uniref:hypothetical protein n=1 Tax=Lacinutrix mariniflava TaxID=342955 RepID=UPI0006E410E3|nr:hypothetical protein [Lacinutrix mariniflava]